MNKLCFYFIVILFSGILFNPVYAQIKKGEYINASIGIGICAPSDESEIDGSGFYAQAEYVLNFNSWIGVRPYVGVVVASGESEEQEMPELRIKSNAALLGAKFRLTAPIPYVAPFVELGFGMSAGSFETHTEYTNLKKNGVLLHVPFTLGLALGRKNNFEVKFSYYYHNSVDQFSGAAALGFSFPIE